MSNWNLGTLMSSATAALGNRTDIPASTVSFWVNEAQRFVWDQLPHDQQEAIAISSTTVNENRITLPTDFQELLVLSNISGGGAPAPLYPMNPWDIDSASTGTSTPTNYMLYADWLELWPSPDSSYSLQMRYRKRLATMTATTAVPSVATRFHYAVFLKATELLAQHVTLDPQTAAVNSNAYVAYMMSTPNDRALRMREQRYVGLSLPTDLKGSRP